MSFLPIVMENLVGYDLLIFGVALLNGLVYASAGVTANRLYRRLHMDVYLPSHRQNPQKIAEAVRAVDEERIVGLRKRSESLYSVVVNLSAIFPLLGILGPVISLLPMVSNLSDMQTNFFAALTSTFWGLVFAILFKFLDGFLASRMEDNSRSVELLLARRSNREARQP